MSMHRTMIVCGDYKGKLKEIIKVLNTLDFDTDDLKFTVVKNEIVAQCCGEHPGAIPVRTVLKFPGGTQNLPRRSG